MKKRRIEGSIYNISTYPLPTLRPSHSNRRSKTLSFDINFDLITSSGDSFHVWFYRGFRFPPPLEDGDRVLVVGRFGQLLGLFARETFYASSIVDGARGRIYTSLRNKRIKGSGPAPLGDTA
ncbi:MAG: hypothetical protein ACYC55_02975 [Candidatus Geothermincolia bacterium]